MRIIRLSKTATVAAIALFASIVAFGNITDYGTNWAFVQHVLSMDTVFPTTTIKYRAIDAPALQTAAYVLIRLAPPARPIPATGGGYPVRLRHLQNEASGARPHQPTRRGPLVERSVPPVVERRSRLQSSPWSRPRRPTLGFPN